MGRNPEILQREEHTPTEEVGEHTRSTGVLPQDRHGDGLARQHGDDPIHHERLQQRAQQSAAQRFGHVTGPPHPCQVRAPGRMTHTWMLGVWAWVSMEAGDYVRLVWRHASG